MLNKYRGPQDVNYCKVAATLIKFAEEADNTIQSRGRKLAVYYYSVRDSAY